MTGDHYQGKSSPWIVRIDKDNGFEPVTQGLCRVHPLIVSILSSNFHEGVHPFVRLAIASSVAPPKAASSGNRMEQMNIRLDAEEKLLLQEAASQRGFRSISDYVRAVALGDARKSA